MADREDQKAATETEAAEATVEAAETVAAEPEAADPESAPTATAVAAASKDDISPPASGGRTFTVDRKTLGALILALGLIGAVVEGWLLFAHHQRTQAGEQALAAAEKYALVLTGVDPAAIDKNFAEVLDGATGEFKEVYSSSSEQLRQLLIDNKAAAHGTVVDSAVKSASKNQVEVLLFIDQSVSNKAVPKPTIDRSRIVMTMEKVNGRWLAAKVDMP